MFCDTDLRTYIATTVTIIVQGNTAIVLIQVSYHTQDAIYKNNT